jgi:hypothetical protein
MTLSTITNPLRRVTATHRPRVQQSPAGRWHAICDCDWFYPSRLEHVTWDEALAVARAHAQTFLTRT